MSQPTALLDANVLYSAPIRDLFLQLANASLFFARWTDSIQDEWIAARLRNDPQIDRKSLEILRRLMETETLHARITDYENVIDSLTMPDPDDRHVLAAAIVGGCDVIVTQNLSDFPQEILAPHCIIAQHPQGNRFKIYFNHRGHREHRVKVLYGNVAIKMLIKTENISPFILTTSASIQNRFTKCRNAQIETLFSLISVSPVSVYATLGG